MNKKEFDEKYVDGKVAVNCKTEELAKKFLKLADKFGYTWIRTNSFTNKTNWKVNREDTVYYVRDGQYGMLGMAKLNGYKIIEFKGENMKNMKNIKIGDKVKCVKKGYYAEVGEIGTIAEIDGDGDYYVQWNRNVGGINFPIMAIPAGHGEFFLKRDNSLELIQEFPEIHITTDGKTTYGVLKQGKEVVKRVEAKLHTDDEFDFEVGSKLVMERLFEEEKELRLIDEYGKDKGKVGEDTDLVDVFGEKLYVGDKVILTTKDNYKFIMFVIKDSYHGYEIQGFPKCKFVQGKYNNDYVIIKYNAFKNLKEGKGNESLSSIITAKLV